MIFDDSYCKELGMSDADIEEIRQLHETSECGILGSILGDRLDLMIIAKKTVPLPDHVKPKFVHMDDENTGKRLYFHRHGTDYYIKFPDHLNTEQITELCSQIIARLPATNKVYSVNECFHNTAKDS